MKEKSGALSAPALTFSHSTSALPLNFFGSVGLRTTIRVRYDALALRLTFQRPSFANGPAAIYDVALPEAKYSDSAYPAAARSVGVEPRRKVPFPPVTGPLIAAAGPVAELVAVNEPIPGVAPADAGA